MKVKSETDDKGTDIPVRVALRIRPLVPKEIGEGSQECIDVVEENNQIVLRGKDKAFTYDYVFDTQSTQDMVYNTAISKLIVQLFKGYNVTILAYGQTGSGKTHTMGTNSIEIDGSVGIIPRVITDIFNEIYNKEDEEILVAVSFVELYKETLYDLLSTKSRDNTVVDVREDCKGGIKIAGLTELPVTSLDESMKCLTYGASNRATGATAMNAKSSRSHAIFSLHLEIKNKKEHGNLRSAKFHLVDLAGSERVKKTKATGERLKEGVNINMGLLALGNVISALCGEGNGSHIPYRDSKLTRLLQDSLGGNSHTVMIGCVSPADTNLEETLSTLRYADRARKIKNKPIVNRDPQAAEMSRLRSQVQELQVKLLGFQAGSSTSVTASSEELNNLLNRNNILEDENEKLTRALQTALEENTNMAEKAIMAEMSRDRLKVKLEELRAQTGTTVENLNKTLDVTINPQFGEQMALIKELEKSIIDLQMDHTNSERAIVDHELSRHCVVDSAHNTPTMDDSNDKSGAESPTKTDFGAAYTLRQAKLNEELHDLNRALAMKEELMTKMSVNDDRYISMKGTYERSLKEFENQITILIKEKDQLNQQLRNASSNASSKIAEQRRKRLQELEGQITDYRKKVSEQNRLLKMKEQSELKVKQLNNDIQSMKSVRVKLIKQMKDDNEKFRTWKNKKDKEVAQLKQADRKKQFQIVKMERMHTKQQNVLKRKMEEAVSINKRLKDAMALQKACQERRDASKHTETVAARVNNWLQGELEIIGIKRQAKISLESLMEGRKAISEQINKIKLQLSLSDLNSSHIDDLNAKKETLENDLEMRTAQIRDMQDKVVDYDTETLCKKRFSNMQTMIEAKCAMAYLFNAAIEQQANVFTKESDFKDLQCQYDEVSQALEEAESEMKDLKEAQLKTIERLSREHEDKILFLLRQMPKTDGSANTNDKNGNEASSDEALLMRLKFQEQELERLSNLHQLLQEKTIECEEYKAKMENQFKVPTVAPVSVSKPPPKPARISLKPATFETDPDIFSSEEDEPEDSESDEEKSDPNWKRTPLFRKIRQITLQREMRNRTKGGSDDETLPLSATLGVKRNSSGDTKCKCVKGNCSKCSCSKTGSGCTLLCKCNPLVCSNKKGRDQSMDNSDSSKGETLLNSTFEVSLEPNPLVENQNKRMRILSPKYYDGEENDPSIGNQEISSKNYLSVPKMPNL